MRAQNTDACAHRHTTVNNLVAPIQRETRKMKRNERDGKRKKKKKKKEWENENNNNKNGSQQKQWNRVNKLAVGKYSSIQQGRLNGTRDYKIYTTLCRRTFIRTAACYEAHEHGTCICTHVSRIYISSSSSSTMCRGE